MSSLIEDTQVNMNKQDQLTYSLANSKSTFDT